MILRKWPPVYAHCDVNACYASLAILEMPYLRGKCVSVGGDELSRRGIVLASNSEVKKFGVRTGMALWEARSLCPKLEIVPIHVLGRKTIPRMTDDLVDMCFGITPNCSWRAMTESTWTGPAAFGIMRKRRPRPTSCGSGFTTAPASRSALGSALIATLPSWPAR